SLVTAARAATMRSAPRRNASSVIASSTLGQALLSRPGRVGWVSAGTDDLVDSPTPRPRVTQRAVRLVDVGLRAGLLTRAKRTRSAARTQPTSNRRRLHESRRRLPLRP